MDRLEVEDVRRIVSLLGEVAVLDAGAPGKRRFLISRVAELIDAQIWCWLHFRLDPGNNMPPIELG